MWLQVANPFRKGLTSFNCTQQSCTVLGKNTFGVVQSQWRESYELEGRRWNALDKKSQKISG